MLSSRLLIALFVSILILTLIEEQEVGAAPEPCGNFFERPKHEKHEKPKDDDGEKDKDKDKTKKDKKKKEKMKLIEKFFEDLLGTK